MLLFPERVDSCGGKYHFSDDGWTMYDTLDTSLFFPGNKIIKIDSKSRNRYLTYGSETGTIIFGTEGSMLFSGQGYQQFDRSGRLVNEGSSDINATISHFANFFDSIRGKAQPNSPVEDAEKSTLYCHLANISYRMRMTTTELLGIVRVSFSETVAWHGPVLSGSIKLLLDKRMYSRMWASGLLHLN